MSATDRALVLGGGGITGIAWEWGLLAGFAAAGVHLEDASLMVGTSAGSAVGGQLLSGRTVEQLYAGQLRAATGEIAAALNLSTLVRYVLAVSSSRNEARARARLGRAALRARPAATVGDRRAVIAARLGGTTWATDRRLLVTAVDAERGTLRVFDGSDGVDLVDAVAASCAVPLIWPPVPIGERFFIDGGTRSPANADLATGAGRVVVLAPIDRATRRSGRIQAQLASLGPNVRSVVVTPDDQAKAAIGRNVLDPARRAPAARAGRDQAARELDAVRAVWE